MKNNYLFKRGSLFMAFLFILMTTQIFGQTKVSGVVIDATTQEPLIGAEIFVKGSTTGTITDFDGKYMIEVDKTDAVLEFSYIGYASQQVAVAGQSEINVELTAAGIEFDEIVVTALGIEREEKAIGYAVQEVSGEKIAATQSTNALSGLSGKVAGLTVSSSGNGLASSNRMIIRGESSLNINGNSPLIVIDGIPVNNNVYGVGGFNTQQTDLPTDYGNAAAEINPEDIESVSVLKGAAATALYGSRAGNGAIIISTKSGKGQKGIGVQFSSSTMFSSPLVLPELQQEYGGGWGLQYYADYGTNFGPKFDSNLMMAQDGSPNFENGEELPFIQRYDIADFFETGLTLNNQISISGSNNKGNFKVSFADSKNKGIVPNTNLDRNTVSLNSTYNLSEKLRVDLSGTYINSKSDNLPVTGYGSQGIMYVLYWNYNNASMDWFKDYWKKGLEQKEEDYIFSWADNPYLIVNENINAFDKDRLFGKIAATLDITPSLSLMGRVGTDYFDDFRWSRRPVGSHRYKNGMYREQDIRYRESNVDFLLTYNKRFNNISTVVSVGANRMDQFTTENKIEGKGLSIPGIYTLGNINVQPSLYRYNGQKRINSVYGFVNLGFKDFVYLDLTARNDWSSTLPADNWSYFYPSASLSVIPSEVVDMGNAIDYMKVRFNVASVGNDTDPYQLEKTFRFATLPNSLTTPNQLPNANLKPVQTTSTEFGIKTVMFKNRLSLDLSYYNSLSKDQIISAGISEASGYSSVVINAGEIKNWGFEAVLGLTPIKTKSGFTWDILANFTKANSEVVELAEGLNTFIIGYGPAGATVEARPGGRMGDIYGSVFMRSPSGEIVYGSNGIPLLDPNRQTVGNYNPDWLMGIGSQFSYKGLGLNASFDIRQGGIIYSYSNAIGAESGLFLHSLPGREDGIVGDGVMLDDNGNYVPNTTVASTEAWYYGGYYARENVEVNSFDASYVKLRELSLSYRLPSRLTKKIGLQNLTVALVGNNIGLWTDVPNIDPEAQALNGGTLVPGFEVVQLPSTKSYGFKLNIGL